MIRLGILGCGRIGKVHARSAMLNARCKVTAVADAQPDAARAPGEQIGARAQSANEIIAALDIDAIIVCSPTDTHSDYIEASAGMEERGI